MYDQSRKQRWRNDGWLLKRECSEDSWFKIVGIEIMVEQKAEGENL
jgi:hypothetical protein